MPHNLHSLTRDEALAAIADSPATLEMRAVALEADSIVVRSGGGLLLVDDRRTLACAMGPVVASDLDELERQFGKARELLADRPAFEVLKASRSLVRATISVLARDWVRPACRVEGLEIRLLAPSDSLDHLEEELLGELRVAKETAPAIHAGFLDGLAVGFSYCASMTETHADISIDTIEGYRRRGIASAVVSALIDEMIRQGKQPVWGALDDNTASLALAASLGFTRRAGELFVGETQ